MSKGTFQTRRVTAVAGGHAVHDTFTAFLPPLLPRLIDRFSLSNAAAGALTVFIQIPSLIQPFIGRLADRTTLRALVIAAPGVTATLMSIIGWAPSYAVLALILFTAGVSVAGFHAVAPAAVGRLAGNRLGRGMGFFMVGGEVGRTLGPLVVVSMLGLAGIRSLALLSLFGIAASVLLWTQLHDAPLEPPAEAPHIPWRTALRDMRPTMTVMAGLVTVRALMMAAAVTYLAVYLTGTGMSEWTAGASISVVEAFGVAGALAGGWVSDRIGRIPVLAFGHVAAPIGVLALTLIPGWGRLLVLPAIGLSLLSIQPVLLAIVQERFTEMRAFANGVYLALSFLIRSITVIGFGAAADAFGLPIVMRVAAFAMLAGVPLVFLLQGGLPRHRAVRS